MGLIQNRIPLNQLVYHHVSKANAITIWVNYNDLTTTSLESWLVREIIPKWP